MAGYQRNTAQNSDALHAQAIHQLTPAPGQAVAQSGTLDKQAHGRYFILTVVHQLGNLREMLAQLFCYLPALYRGGRTIAALPALRGNPLPLFWHLPLCHYRESPRKMGVYWLGT
ncbi:MULTISPECIES: hypothetical protein [unclassified Pseudomonas]|uniref:hypothetical protein n=1 Tax=unclassified Pseudomonas TaxID=196821 RepID=UPI000837CCD9|nr:MULTISPECIES: hypothetical protein [unclassified Pseudomonas]QIH06936.1 hypothetical protein ATY02_09525 [Pseudomonas sp. BIOMIG1BAC]